MKSLDFAVCEQSTNNHLYLSISLLSLLTCQRTKKNYQEFDFRSWYHEHSVETAKSRKSGAGEAHKQEREESQGEESWAFTGSPWSILETSVSCLCFFASPLTSVLIWIDLIIWGIKSFRNSLLPLLDYWMYFLHWISILILTTPWVLFNILLPHCHLASSSGFFPLQAFADADWAGIT